MHSLNTVNKYLLRFSSILQQRICTLHKQITNMTPRTVVRQDAFQTHNYIVQLIIYRRGTCSAVRLMDEARPPLNVADLGMILLLTYPQLIPL